MSALTLHRFARRNVFGFLPFLVTCGCLDATSTSTAPRETVGQKARPLVSWLARPQPFVRGLRLGSLAVTPSRMLATTVGAAEAKLVIIDAHGAVTPHPVALDAPPEQVCHLGVSPGFSGSFPEDTVVASRGREVLRLLPGANAWEPILTLAEADGEVAGLCFDPAGSFGHALLVLASGGRVFLLRGDLSWWAVGEVGPGGQGPSVVHSPAHEFHGRLVVAFPASGDVRAMDSNGRLALVTRWSGVSGAIATPARLQPFADTGSTLFVAVDDGFVYRFAIEDVEPHVGGMLLTSLNGSGSALAMPFAAGVWLRAWSRHHGPEVAAAFVQRSGTTRVAIDVKTANRNVPLGSTTPIPVALLSSTTFIPRFVDGDAVRCAGAAPVPVGKGALGSLSELNGDGEPDLTLYFRPADMAIVPGTATLVLEGSTFEGQDFRGEDVVRVIAP